MREGMSLQTRRELLQHMLPQYRGASTVKKKSKRLDAFTAATGYNRKYAMGLLNHAQVEQSTPQRPRPRHYGPEVQHALFLVWHVANRICAKRLIPFLPTLLEALERHEHLHISEECRRQLLSISAAKLTIPLHASIVSPPLLFLSSLKLNSKPASYLIPFSLWNLIILCYCERCFELVPNRSIRLTGCFVQLVDKGLYLLLVLR